MQIDFSHDTEAALSWLNVETQSSGGRPGPLAVTYTVNQTHKCKYMLSGVSCLCVSMKPAMPVLTCMLTQSVALAARTFARYCNHTNLAAQRVRDI